MGQGFQEKIDTIVDSIVSLEKEKNKKIDKYSISDSIKLSISELNDIGKILVLNDLEKEAGQTPSNLLTIDGKISEEKLREVVDNKIKEAEKEGIDLRADAKQVFKNNKISAVEGIITIAAINTMVNNFKDLTPAERTILRENYEFLNSEQRAKYDRGMVDNIKESDFNDEEKTKLTNIFEGDFHQCINQILDNLQKKYGTTDLDFSKISQTEIANLIKGLSVSDEMKQELLKYKFDKLLTVDKTRQEYADLNIQLVEAVKNGNEELVYNLERKITDIEKSEDFNIGENFEKLENSKEKGEAQNQKENQRKESLKESATQNSQAIIGIKENINNETELDQEIQQIPIALVKLNFSQEEIKESLDKYIFTFKNMDEDDINELKGLDKNQLRLSMNKVFVMVGINEEIAKFLSQITYNKQLITILEDETKKQEFLEQLDQSIAQEINPNETVELAGELKDAIESYLEEQEDEQSFEDSESSQSQEQPSSNFNQETIRDELSAIPVALSNIEGIDRADIISGMQGYKQLLDSIDISSLQGKSNDEVLQILMSKTAEIGLQGNANEILLMMSQIGFSKGGNMQIADILTTSKDVFTALVDEASKEENIDKAIQENQAQKPITDKEATPGMRYLIEDLNFARPSENKLGDQVIANDGNVFDSTSASDTDAAQGTTSTGKLKVSAIEKHVQDRPMSAVKNQFDLISEIIKNEEKGKDVKEQDETEGPEV